jgi:hypothetical protein
MAGLLDFLQSASNTVAGNVAGPVDVINAGLGLLGIPVSKAPVGGSEWMKQRGLIRDVPQGTARIAGETAGLLAPTMIVAKAPQIASGINQMVQNAMIPRRLNPETGAIIDDANKFAQLVREQGKQFNPKIIEDKGGSVYVMVEKLPLTKAGEIAKNRRPFNTGFKARFADHPSYWGSSISSDPITQNTVSDVFDLFSHKLLGYPAPKKYVSSYFVPQDGGSGVVSEKTLKLVPSVSGKSMVEKYFSEDRPFTFIGDRFSRAK